MLDDTKPRARTLAARHYTSTQSLAAERELLLRSWQLAGHQSQLAEPGDFITLSLFEQNIFLVRDREGEVRAYYNVCPHRGHQLVEGSGQKAVLTCPYHAWTFGLDGRLRGLPKRDGTDAPARSEVCLTSVRVDTLAGFLFVNLDESAPSLAEFAPGLEAQLLERVPELSELEIEGDSAYGHTYSCKANWKVMLDNYLECHHCGPAHHSFDDMMNIAENRFELYQNYTYQMAPTARKAENAAFRLDLDHDVLDGQFWFLFPNTVFGQFPGARGFYASRFDPVTPDFTERRSFSLIAAEPTDPDMKARAAERAEWSTNVVSAEDRALCESVQRGMHQKGYQQGWYITDPDAHDISEHAMRHFHDIYLAAMDEEN
ncbi:MAG: aromatic ring-hydroxylating dioxygenase subunit alpha [Rhodobacteraceae bacterium]|nr:aromatic ring-hydroxylating dioxygenase subunit alpha [Paracoccaceae bacterium]